MSGLMQKGRPPWIPGERSKVATYSAAPAMRMGVDRGTKQQPDRYAMPTMQTRAVPSSQPASQPNIPCRGSHEWPSPAPFVRIGS